MMFKYKLLALFLSITPLPLMAAESQGQCADNFVISGSWSSGRTYHTYADHSGVNYDVAFEKATKNITDDGLVIVDQSKERGYIRANNPVRGGSGGTAVAPLRVLVIGKPGAVRIDARFSIAGGQMTSKKAILQHLCALVNSPVN